MNTAMLKTLIDVSVGIRLPQNEPEIFSDVELTEYYLHKLCEQHVWYIYDTAAPRMIYHYARYVMKSRWVGAEPVIITDPLHASKYAANVMKCRWPEAEHVIATGAYWRTWYNRVFDTNI